MGQVGKAFVCTEEDRKWFLGFARGQCQMALLLLEKGKTTQAVELIHRLKAGALPYESKELHKAAEECLGEVSVKSIAQLLSLASNFIESH